nr:hypothetical protein [Tanacetum cinerariifolium]
MTKDEASNEIEVPPVTSQQILARTRERKAKSTLHMAIPDQHLARSKESKMLRPYGLLLKLDFVRLQITRNSGNMSRDVGNAGYKGRDNGKRPAKKEDEKALVVLDGLGTCD